MGTESRYKEITMIVGVAVAMIIVVTLWMRNPESKQAALVPQIELPAIKKPATPALLKLSATAVKFVNTYF